MRDRITLTLWRDAKADPPEQHIDPYGAAAPNSVLRVRSTGQVVLAYPDDEDVDTPTWLPIYDGTEHLDDLTRDWAFPPSPPGDDALTLEHLSALADFPYLRFAVPHLQTLLDAQASLRRALATIENAPPVRAPQPHHAENTPLRAALDQLERPAPEPHPMPTHERDRRESASFRAARIAHASAPESTLLEALEATRALALTALAGRPTRDADEILQRAERALQHARGAP